MGQGIPQTSGSIQLVRTVQLSDAAAIAELEIELFPGNCFNERTLLIELERGSGTVVMAKGELVGYALIRWDWELVDIIRIGVKPSHRGKGIATRMLAEILGNSHLDCLLCVDKANILALRLYKSHGFEIVAETGNSWVMVMRRVTF